MNNHPVKILIVDDHPIVLAGVCALLSEDYPEACIETASGGEEALEKARNGVYDVFILDVELSDMTGIDLIRMLRCRYEDASFVFHTMHEEMWVVKRLMASGADAIVFKSDDVGELRCAVGKVLDGESYYSRRFEEYCTRYEQEVLPSARELEILRMLASGANSKEIADRIFLSVNTVEFHRKRLFRRLGVSNMAELMVEAMNRGLLLLENRC